MKLLFYQNISQRILNSFYGFPPKIIWIRTGNLKSLALMNLLIDNWLEIRKFVEDENFGCFEIVRIRK